MWQENKSTSQQIVVRVIFDDTSVYYVITSTYFLNNHQDEAVSSPSIKHFGACETVNMCFQYTLYGDGMIR
jgi:hypothetical protein